MESIQWRHLWNRLKVIASEDIGLAADPGFVADIETLYRWYEDGVKRGNGVARLHLAHAVVMMCRAPKSRYVDMQCLNSLVRTERMEVPDEAIDKHTNRGRRMKRDINFFIDEGIKVWPHQELEGEDAVYAEYEANMRREAYQQPIVPWPPRSGGNSAAGNQPNDFSQRPLWEPERDA